MKIKVYYFRYANTLDKFMMNLLSFFVNFAFPIVTFYAIAIITGIFGINKYLGADVLTVLLIVSIALGLICGIKFCVCFKGITLYDSYMEISTQTIGFGKISQKLLLDMTIFQVCFKIHIICVIVGKKQEKPLLPEIIRIMLN